MGHLLDVDILFRDGEDADVTDDKHAERDKSSKNSCTKQAT
jgi:hypothetical protein